MVSRERIEVIDILMVGLLEYFFFSVFCRIRGMHLINNTDNVFAGNNFSFGCHCGGAD